MHGTFRSGIYSLAKPQQEGTPDVLGVASAAECATEPPVPSPADISADIGIRSHSKRKADHHQRPDVISLPNSEIEGDKDNDGLSDDEGYTLKSWGEISPSRPYFILGPWDALPPVVDYRSKNPMKERTRSSVVIKKPLPRYASRANTIFGSASQDATFEELVEKVKQSKDSMKKVGGAVGDAPLYASKPRWRIVPKN